MSKSADGSVSSELSLQIVEWKDEGTYTCSAREITSAAEGAKPTRQEIMLEIYGEFLIKTSRKLQTFGIPFLMGDFMALLFFPFVDCPSIAIPPNEHLL